MVYDPELELSLKLEAEVKRLVAENQQNWRLIAGLRENNAKLLEVLEELADDPYLSGTYQEAIIRKAINLSLSS